MKVIGKVALLVFMFFVYTLIFGIVMQSISGAIPMFVMALLGGLFFIWFAKYLFKKKRVIGSISIDEELHRNQEILSCPTCMFFNKQITKEKPKWCNAPSGPDIGKNYCNTFKSNKLGGKG